jgi:hypothetical protein
MEGADSVASEADDVLLPVENFGQGYGTRGLGVSKVSPGSAGEGLQLSEGEVPTSTPSQRLLPDSMLRNHRLSVEEMFLGPGDGVLHGDRGIPWTRPSQLAECLALRCGGLAFPESLQFRPAQFLLFASPFSRRQSTSKILEVGPSEFGLIGQELSQSLVDLGMAFGEAGAEVRSYPFDLEIPLKPIPELIAKTSQRLGQVMIVGVLGELLGAQEILVLEGFPPVLDRVPSGIEDDGVGVEMRIQRPGGLVGEEGADEIPSGSIGVGTVDSDSGRGKGFEL